MVNSDPRLEESLAKGVSKRTCSKGGSDFSHARHTPAAAMAKIEKRRNGEIRRSSENGKLPVGQSP